MDTDAKGQLGGMDASEEVRKRLASQSNNWKCSTCGKVNEAIMKEQDDLVKEKGEDSKLEEVPEELRLAYREDLSSANGDAGKAAPDATAKETAPPSVSSANTAADPVMPTTQQMQQQQPPAPVNQPPQTQHAQQRRQDEGIPPWIDKAIYGILAVLFYLLYKKILV